MNIEALEYFKKVADFMSISKVSQQSHISQSALSQMMQKLEDSIGHELLIRSNKGVELTKMGKIVYEYADTIIKTYQKMQDELDCLENNQCNVIINSTWAISNYSLPCLLVEIKNKYPQFSYELRSNRSEDITKNVMNGLVDFGIIYGKPESQELVTYPFGEDEIVLVARKDYIVKNKITIDELLNCNLINFKHGCYYTDIKQSITKLRDNFHDYESQLKNILVLDSISAVKSSVSEGFGLSFLPYSSVKKEIQNNHFKLIEIENLILKLKVNIISLHKEKLSAPVLKVIDIFLKLGTKSLC